MALSVAILPPSHDSDMLMSKYQHHHQSLPPTPPSPQPISNRDAHSHRHSWSRKPQLCEISEETDDENSLMQMHETTQFILQEIKQLAQDAIEADARAESFQRQYMETRDELDALKLAHTSILQRLQQYQDQQQQQQQQPYNRYRYYPAKQQQQRYVNLYKQQPSSLSSTSSSTTASTTLKTAFSKKKKLSSSLPSKLIRFLGLSRK
ncbi:hypothetical protein BDB00DRAFT_932054 [Zychaea mexicana]|uniref:uncharacterized protein n=1 Tax=Zychaea mexicana TaxID=64656 RepID=UPI0022FECF51|nr:uncharacterized protein BDB00DRAFT_932054 [Zychaea mexicana]KAI9489281.1 hypothetical protein BDB00DRAFT_932054 [Zychaea mexicana]